MSLHEESLKNLCRKCGLKIKKDSHYQLKPVIIYKHTILSFYKLDITSDHQKVHPEYLCKSCYMVLYRLDLKTKNSFVIERSDKFFTFTEHTETCYVCNTLTKVGRNKKVPAINTNQQLKTIASKHGFDCYNENNKNYFVIVEINSCRQIVSKTLSLESNSMWRLIVLNREVPLSNNVIKLPVHLNLQSADIIFSTISCVNICKGNNDFHYLIRNKFSDFKNFQSTSNEDVGIIEMEEGNTVDNFKVIRHKEKERKENLAKQQRMQKKLEKSIIEEGVVLEEEEHTIIKETNEKYGEENPFTEDSPQALLWQQQKIQAGLKDRRSMRWHPLIIRWCISLYLKSPSAYRHICSTPFLNLPCKNTVQKYINFTDPGCGFNKDVMYNLTKKIDLPNIKEHQRYVSIIVDEMKIKSGLAFSSSTGKLVGFSESGSINELLLNFENKYTENKGKSNVEDPTDIPLASYVTVLMVRGITSSLKYVFGHFASAGGLSSSQLYFTIWDGVRQLESVGLKVMAIVADGASPNRKFMRLHSWKSEENTKDGVIYWTWNECCPDRKMFFICDVPHLIKTTRNNLEKSHENSSSRSLMIDGQPLVWDQIIRLYDWDLGIDRDAVGLTMGHKLSEEHINLNSRTRMRVNLAVQVLSSTVADMLEEQGLHSTKSLIKFIRMIDKFFDCLNVSKNFNYSRKPDLDRYKAIDDVRFDWLQNTFLTFINNWEEQCQNIPDLSQAEKNRFCLSKQTLEGLRITVNSFTTLGKFLLVEGAEYILSEKFCQDPLEEYFGKQRMRLGSNDNPLLIEFNSNALGLNVAGDNLIRVFGSNTKGRKDEFQKLDVKNTDLPLSKKRKNDLV